MKRRVRSLVICSIALLMLSGCVSLNSSVPFQYQPSLIASTNQINMIAGLNMLKDARPDGDISYTKSIKDVSEKVTAKLLEDFQKSGLFKEIQYPAQADNDIVISGSIDRFIWKSYASPIAFIPFVNILIYFGVPCQEAYGIAEITLEVKDNKADKLLGRFTESLKEENSYTLYNAKAGEAGAELQEAFRNVAKKLKEDILKAVQ